jgi:hypothetical protein
MVSQSEEGDQVESEDEVSLDSEEERRRKHPENFN